MLRIAVLVGVAGLCGARPATTEGEAARVQAVVGLDHIPIAVHDLESSAEEYRELGFTLKPGRPHANGIRNQHVKFPDGTELELITAADVRDGLTATYRRHLEAGDGPAFLALFAPVPEAVTERLDATRTDYRREGGLLTFPDADRLHYLFFGQRNLSPTDRPEHFAHPNSAVSLIAVWLAGDDLSAERRLLATLGATIEEEEVHVPDRRQGTVAHLQEGEVVLLPGARQLVPGRRIIGATVRVGRLAMARRALAGGEGRGLPTVHSARGSSVFLPAAMTRGIWLELREAR